MSDRERPRAEGGEHSLPLEHTLRVQAVSEVGSPPAEGSSEEEYPEPEPFIHAIHDLPPPPAPGSSERERKARRRERDARAERRAIQLGLGGFVGLGIAVLVFVNIGLSDQPSEPTARVDAAPRAEAPAEPSPAPVSPKGPARQSTSQLDETPDLPALGMLSRRGLTVGAEGIPNVSSAVGGVQTRAGIESCRFAYGVWELSPNQTFRFLTTCEGLGYAERVGAYELRGATLYLSLLTQGDVRWTSVLELEHPSKMKTSVLAGGTKLDVEQRITIVREGLHGDDFRDALRRRNSLSLPSQPAAPPPKTNPLEALIGGGNR